MMRKIVQKKRAIAIISVVTAIVFLAMIATPFVISMILQKKSSHNFLNQTKAKIAARGALEYSKYYLARGEYTKELALKKITQQNKTISIFATPDYDTYKELFVEMKPLAKYLKGIPFPQPKEEVLWASEETLNIFNQKGIFWSVEVEDEQAKVNLNSASPWLLGNIFASASVTEKATSTDTTLSVESTQGFNPKGGILWYQGELISYQRTSPTAFLRCARGLQSQLPEFENAKTIRKGSVLIDGRAHKVSAYPYKAISQEFIPFLNINQIKNIADYGHSAFNANEVDQWLPFITVHSHRPYLAGWSQTTTLLQDFDVRNNQDGKGSVIRIETGSNYTNGTLVRIRNNLRTEYSRIRGFSGNSLLLEDQLRFSYKKEDTKIDFGVLHPVNLNTARTEVLTALFTGVELYKSKDPVTRKQAEVIAQTLIAESLKDNYITSAQSFYDFLVALRKLEVINNAQVAALYLNATNPYGRISLGGISRHLVAHTAPFCFKGSDTYTVRATGIVNSPTGLQQASHTIQEVVRVSPEEVLFKSWETQKDFFEELPQSSQKVVTWPTPMTGIKVKPDTSDQKDKGDVRILPSETLGAHLSFPHTIEGAIGPHVYGSYPLVNSFNINSGYTEFWVKSLAQPGNSYFYAGAPNSAAFSVDQIQLYYDQQNIYFQLSDPCLDNKFAAVIYPYPLRNRVWYHFSGAWLNSRYGALALLMDGVPVGQFDYIDVNGNSLTTELTSDVTDIKELKIYVKSTKNFPKQGAFRIGEEIIEYESKSGKYFKVWEPSKTNVPKPRGFSGLTSTGRGARTSKSQIITGVNNLGDFASMVGISPKTLGQSKNWTPLIHPKGTIVEPFGYSNRVLGQSKKLGISSPRTGSVGTFDLTKIYTGQGYLKESLDEFFAATAVNQPDSGILATDNTIPVNSTRDFPKKGYAVIGNELVFYGSKSPTSFNGVKRGQAGTLASAHSHGAPVRLNSILLSSTKKYADNGWFQIDQEWFGPYSKLGSYFIGMMAESNGQIFPTLLGRGGAYGPKKHKIGAKVIPVFAVQTPACGAGDLITVIDTDNDPNNRYAYFVQWSESLYSPSFTDSQKTFFNAETYYLVALNDFVTREIKSADHGRLLKFPSGELPAQTLNGVYGDSPDQKIYDEIKTLSGGGSFGYQLPHDLAANAKYFISYVKVEKGRLIKIGDELMVTQDIENLGQKQGLPFSAYLVGPLVRGVLNTTPTIHASATQYYILDYVPSALLEQGMDSKAAKIFLKQNSSQFPSQGYLRMHNEVIGYTQRSGFQFQMPTRNKKDGIFRQSFGSPKSSHQFGDVAIFQPYRYWDFYATESDSSEVLRHSIVFSSLNTLFRSFRWEEERHKSSRLDVVCLVRFNGSPDWESTPTNKKGGLFLFDESNSNHSFGGAGIQASQIEMRFLFRYHQGAFQGDIWKETPWLKKVDLEYYRPTQTLHYQEKQ